MNKTRETKEQAIETARSAKVRSCARVNRRKVKPRAKP
jgi:hypothetical protein